MLGARQRDIGQPQFFGGIFAVGLVAQGIDFCGAEVEAGIVFSMREHRPALGIEARSVPQEWAVDDGILQALGGVNGDDAHQLRVAFQAQLRFFSFVAGAGIDDVTRQAFDVERAGVFGRLQQFGQMAVIRHAPLAVRPRQDARDDAFASQQPPPQRHEAALAIEQQVVVEAVEALAPGAFVGGPCRQLRRIAAEQHRRQCRPHQPLARRGGHGKQDALDLLGFVTEPDAAAAERDAGDAAPRQGLLDHLALLMLAHQHGNVATRQRARAKLRPARRRQRQQSRNVGGHRAGHQRLRQLFRQPALPCRLRQRPQRECRGIASVIVDAAAGARHRRRPGRFERQAVDQEGTRTCEQGIHGGQQWCIRAPVFQQRIAGVGLLPRPQIGEHIRAAKAVDGLLGVADENQRMSLLAENPKKDFELQRVGVLEFVDQRRPVAIAQGAGERSAGRALQRVGQVGEQVVIGHLAAAALSGGQFGACREQEVMQQAARVSFIRGVETLGRQQECVDRAKERMFGWRAGLGAFLADLRQPEKCHGLGQGERRAGAGENLAEQVDARLHFLWRINTLIQFGSGQPGADFRGIALPERARRGKGGGKRPFRRLPVTSVRCQCLRIDAAEM